jgi:hypothetical protein
MKIYVTTFIHDGKEYVGPDIHAETFKNALLIAESQGLVVQGELTDLVDMSTEEVNLRPKVIH